MSLETTRIHCTDCDYEYFELYRPIELKCAFGPGFVTYYRTRAWCHDCGSIRYAEQLPTMTRLKRELLCLTGKGFGAWLRRLLPSHRAQFKDQYNRMQWRRARTTPPRCLHCGSTNISGIRFRHVSGTVSETHDFRHFCGGRLIHDYADKTGTRYHLRHSVIWLDPEGNRDISQFVDFIREKVY